MAYEFKMERRVEFADTDMAGILHFSNYFRFMEATEHAFFRSLGLRVHKNEEQGVWGWVRVETECSFQAPLYNEDVVEVHLLVSAKKPKALSYEFVFRKDAVEVARGSLTAVCVARREDGNGIRAIAIPEDVDRLVEVAPRD